MEYLTTFLFFYFFERGKTGSTRYMATKETAESLVILSLGKNGHTTNEVLFCCMFKSAFFFRSLYIFIYGAIP